MLVCVFESLCCLLELSLSVRSGFFRLFQVFSVDRDQQCVWHLMVLLQVLPSSFSIGLWQDWNMYQTVRPLVQEFGNHKKIFKELFLKNYYNFPTELSLKNIF